MRLPHVLPSPRCPLAGLAMACALAAGLAGPARAAGPPVDPAPFERVLARYVRDGRVDYRALAADRAARADLARYTAALAAADTTGWPRAEQLAFWINAYNAITLERVVEAWPVSSILRIRPTLGVLPGDGVWKEPHRVAGAELSLDDIEHRVLRGRFADPRVHFAINCASRSCPPLAGRPWRAAGLDSTLDHAARDFVRDARYNRIPAGATEWQLSRIFDWYRGDFEAAAGSLAAYVLRYLPADRAPAVPAGEVRIRYLPYDWGINAR